MNPYCLAKITKREYAETLLDGAVFMSPLSSFGDLGKRSADSNNNFRGDVLEGVSQSFSPGNEPPAFKDILGEATPYIGGMGQIAECFLQERVYCLYCLEYCSSHRNFIAPDPRCLDFGDTAVIILDPSEFLRRICYRLLEIYGNSFWAGAKRVQYSVDLTEFTEFTKADSYSWQNEYRIALDLSGGKADQEAWESMSDLCRIMFLNQGGKVDHTANREPLFLNVGDIRDICAATTTDDFINLNLPFEPSQAEPIVLDPIEPPRRPVVTSYRPVIAAR